MFAEVSLLLFEQVPFEFPWYMPHDRDMSFQYDQEIEKPQINLNLIQAQQRHPNRKYIQQSYTMLFLHIEHFFVLF